MTPGALERLVASCLAKRPGKRPRSMFRILERLDDVESEWRTVVAVQKSRVSFEALTQVRNKLLSAYQDVMNMSV